MRNALCMVGIGAIILVGGWWYLAHIHTETARNTHTPTPQAAQGGHEESPPTSAPEHQGASIGEENLIEFTCANSKSMTAVFTRDILGLTLSDGRQLTLRQAVSGSGIRYLNTTETIEFRGKGSNATLTESGGTTYQDCKAAQ